jgi:hypothetical protein
VNQPSLLAASTLCESHRDPVDGLEGFRLVRPPGWQLQSFYFTNTSMSLDGRWLWCYCKRSLAERSQLAVADLQRGDLHIVENSTFGDASPMVDLTTGDCYWIGGAQRTELMRYRVSNPDRIEVLGAFPAELLKGRSHRRIATHLTFTADRRKVVLDAEIGGEEWIAGTMDLADGKFEPWGRFDVCYNHAQASPIDPERMLIAQDFWNDPVSGEKMPYHQRLWLLDRNGNHRPLYPEPTPRHGHEWWAADGSAVWYVHYDHGVRRHRIADGHVDAYWHGKILHAHCDRDETIIVGDSWNKGRIMGVHAYDIATGRECTIAEPAPMPSDKGHLHPHPQISANGAYVIHTAFTADDGVTVGLTPLSSVRAGLARGG